ncbi:IMEF encapsulin system ferritin-like cargo protein [Bacillus taeanensis]|uniref:Encapsulated protein n=1 Tax=Bacillus taeanensis TaxID=273032 RepID=A0A366XPM8_9BACI|nr:IMEF encapsulin system ferritin-like cargo protein [Bacillus taeanensis]RBW68320.1 hypothetical protein DS031_17525 [Bacillus taeanensis]
MSAQFLQLQDIFIRTKEAAQSFMKILEPTIENAKEEHERLYFHHIYEEEEHRLDRLESVIPKLEYFLQNMDGQHTNNHEFVKLLQDVSLEKFGLHNFLEHLDLALFQFKSTEHENTLQGLRDLTYNDYQKSKELLQVLNDQFDGAANSAASIPTDEKEGINEHLKIEKYTTESPASRSSEPIGKPAKRLTVGSLKTKKEII